MASIVSDPNGRKRIQFVAADGTRPAIRLGKASMKQAEAFKVKVEQLASACITGSMEDETARWLASLDDRMHGRLAGAGLVKPRDGGRAALGAFIDHFIENCTAAKPNTLENMRQVRRWLVGHFGEIRDIRTVSPGEAEDWRAWMVKEGLGENTIRRHIGRARQLLKSAIRRGLVRGANPFDGMAATVRSDKARQFFVTREMAQKVLDVCPDAQWKLLFALSRYGGLRCPSEHLALKWSDVDWERGRIRVPSPKTEHHEGKDCRMIPLFPELRPHLLEVFEQAEPGTEHVITRYRDSACNLRTHFCRIIRKAGLTPWPKPWHNLRSTRQTELAEKYPIHVVRAWLGNSRAVAQEHYLQLTDAHFAHAVQEPPEQAAQNPAQQAAERAGTTSQAAPSDEQKALVFPGESEPCETVQAGKYPRQDSNL